MEISEVKSTSSTEISRNAKGGFAFSVKVYNEDPAKATEEALKLSTDLSAKLSTEPGK